MKVSTKFEVKQFITFVNTNLIPVSMDITDHSLGFFVTKVNGEDYKIHEEVLTEIQTKCPTLKVNYRLVQ